jgi:hypothetical protein
MSDSFGLSMAAAGAAIANEGHKPRDPASQKEQEQEQFFNAIGQAPFDEHASPWAIDEQTMATENYQAWAAEIPAVMNTPVVSAKYVADLLGVTEDQAREAIGAEFASVNDLLDTVVRTGLARRGDDPYSEQADAQSAQVIAGTAQALSQGRGKGRDFNFAELAMGAVAAHAPQGQYAQWSGRSPEEAAAADEKYGSDADMYLTPGGVQNHQALRVAEFLGAARPEYQADTGMAQFGRIAGAPFAPAMRGIQHAVFGESKPFKDQSELLEPLMQAQQMSEPGGRFAYATEMLRRSAPPPQDSLKWRDQDYRVFTETDRPKFSSYDPYTPLGMAHQGYVNASNPVGFGTQFLTPNKQLGDFIGTALGSDVRNAIDYRQAAHDVRMAGNRYTPRQIPGMSQDEFQKAVSAVRTGDAKGDSFASALLGPYASGGKSYLSPFSSGAVNILGELVSEPINVAYTLSAPVGGAITSGFKAAATAPARSLIPRLAAGGKTAAKALGAGTLSSVRNISGDVLDEGVIEPATFGSTMQGFDLFKGQKTNDLMDNADPKTVNVGRVMEANTQRLYDQNEALRPLVERRRESPVRKTMAGASW